MKHLSEDELTKNLETLKHSFQPTDSQKEKVYREVFEFEPKKKIVSTQKLIPTIVSFIVFFVIGAGLIFLVKDQAVIGEIAGKSEVVTSSWAGVRITQSSQTSATNYELIFDEHSLIIEDRFQSLEYDHDMSETNKEGSSKKYQITETSLVAGEYPKYRVVKKGEMYTIKVEGEESFTYTLEKIAPRKFVGEEGIEYSTGTYLE